MEYSRPITSGCRAGRSNAGRKRGRAANHRVTRGTNLRGSTKSGPVRSMASEVRSGLKSKKMVSFASQKSVFQFNENDSMDSDVPKQVIVPKLYVNPGKYLNTAPKRVDKKKRVDPSPDFEHALFKFKKDLRQHKNRNNVPQLEKQGIFPEKDKVQTRAALKRKKIHAAQLPINEHSKPDMTPRGKVPVPKRDYKKRDTSFDFGNSVLEFNEENLKKSCAVKKVVMDDSSEFGDSTLDFDDEEIQSAGKEREMDDSLDFDNSILEFDEKNLKKSCAGKKVDMDDSLDFEVSILDFDESSAGKKREMKDSYLLDFDEDELQLGNQKNSNSVKKKDTDDSSDIGDSILDFDEDVFQPGKRRKSGAGKKKGMNDTYVLDFDESSASKKRGLDDSYLLAFEEVELQEGNQEKSTSDKMKDMEESSFFGDSILDSDEDVFQTGKNKKSSAGKKNFDESSGSNKRGRVDSYLLDFDEDELQIGHQRKSTAGKNRNMDDSSDFGDSLLDFDEDDFIDFGNSRDITPNKFNDQQKNQDRVLTRAALKRKMEEEYNRKASKVFKQHKKWKNLATVSKRASKNMEMEDSLDLEDDYWNYNDHVVRDFIL